MYLGTPAARALSVLRAPLQPHSCAAYSTRLLIDLSDGEVLKGIGTFLTLDCTFVYAEHELDRSFLEPSLFLIRTLLLCVRLSVTCQSAERRTERRAAARTEIACRYVRVRFGLLCMY